MSRTTVPIAALDDWLNTTRRSSAPQYASLLRAFLREKDVLDVQADDLVQLVLEKPSGGMRRKVCNAAVAFFGDLYETSAIPNNPAHRLSAKVREAEALASRRELLLAAGVPELAVEELRWADVIAKLVVDERPRRNISAGAARELEAELFGKLGVKKKRFYSVLRETIA